MSDEARIMAHIVPYYPDKERSWDAARALIDAGVAYLEVQFPYSDPSADGPVIEAACSSVLRNGFRSRDGFEFVREITRYSPVPVYIMTYAGMVFAPGVESFVAAVKAAGATGLIVPDLPVDYDEGVYAAGAAHELEIVPVVVSGSPQNRLDATRVRKPSSVYAALRRGITGAQTAIDQETLEFLRSISSWGVRVYGGFGIRTPEQVAAVAEHVDAVVVGTAFVSTITHAVETGVSVYDAVRSFAASLVNCNE